MVFLACSVDMGMGFCPSGFVDYFYYETTRVHVCDTTICTVHMYVLGGVCGIKARLTPVFFADGACDDKVRLSCLL